MSTQTKMTRTVRKIEAPRPLKSTTSVTNRNSAIDVKINSVEELIILTEAVACQISQKNFDRNLQTNVETMYQFLKMHGAQLESSYKEVLDRFFIVFRDGSQNEKLDKMSRLHLLELIELRAKHWHTTDYIAEYYRYKVTVEEPLLVPTMDPGMGTSSPSPIPEPVPILGPGELIKPSGKFLKPTKIPGKNYSKDEVVIRNADSGKVMGIKGRRVHMIEELSDTVISFQRVSPGAKERLVQITGPNEENVNHAKHLIGDTIRRNASPVRLESSTGAELRASDASLSSDDASPRENRTPPANHRTLLHSFSTNDAALGEYKYTVGVGQHSIKITGHNLELVKTAKLVLDEYFENMAAVEAVAGSGDFFTLARPGQNTPLAPFVPLIPLAPIPAAELNGGANNNDDEVFTPKSPTEDAADSSSSFRRPRFSRGYSTDKKEGLSPAAATRHTYTSAKLLSLAESPLSRVPPATAPPPEIARKVCLDYDGAAHLNASNNGSTFVSEEVPDSPEPE